MHPLKLPRLRSEHAALVPAVPPEPPAGTLLLGRREFLKGVGAILALLAAPVTGTGRALAAARGRFFTRRELATLEALVDRILPPQGPPGRAPGAKALGAARYIHGMLTAFDRRGVPRLYAGGPFSGRNRFPRPGAGGAAARRPRNDFRRFLPLTPLLELRWRAELYGSERVPGADFNDAALGPLPGLRSLYRAGLAAVDEAARATRGARFARLAPADQEAVMRMLDTRGFLYDPRRDATFFDLLIQHTLEGCFAPPEYGGNRRARGWRLLGLEGDSQPLGYSRFVASTNGYVERPAHPVSTPDPGDVGPGGVLAPRPLGPEAVEVQRTIAGLSSAFADC